MGTLRRVTGRICDSNWLELTRIHSYGAWLLPKRTGLEK